MKGTKFILVLAGFLLFDLINDWMSNIYVEIRMWCRCINLYFAAGATEYDVKNMSAGDNQTSSVCYVGNLSKDSFKNGL
jgi:hypothetical protein